MHLLHDLYNIKGLRYTCIVLNVLHIHKHTYFYELDVLYMLIYEIVPIVFIYVITAYDNIFHVWYGNVIYAHILHLFMGLYCLPDVSRHFPYQNSEFFSK